MSKNSFDYRLRLVLIAAMHAVFPGGCDNLSDTSSVGLFGTDPGDREQWTIHCMYTNEPGHEVQCKRLADMLGKVSDLQSQKVRLETSEDGSTIYYGKYVKVASKTTGRLVFPPGLQRDIKLLQRLSYNQTTPFFHARPVLIEGKKPSKRGEWHVSRVQGTHTLLIARFYNTPTFSQRKEAAEQYVEQLRQEGYPAYYQHQQVRSLVYIGHFDESDYIQNPDGSYRLSSRVEQLISKNEQAFRCILDNGFLLKHHTPDGRVMASKSYLVKVPRDDG